MRTFTCCVLGSFFKNSISMPSINIDYISDTYSLLLSQYISILESMTDEQLNEVPSPGSWSAAQVVRHIVKANDSGFLFAPGTVPDRDIGLHIPDLKENFLNFEIKMQSPEFIIPENRFYTKQECLESIQMVFNNLIQNLPAIDLSIEFEAPFGMTTKWELANFIVFHSQRHLNQLQNIQKSVR